MAFTIPTRAEERVGGRNWPVNGILRRHLLAAVFGRGRLLLAAIFGGATVGALPPRGAKASSRRYLELEHIADVSAPTGVTGIVEGAPAFDAFNIAGSIGACGIRGTSALTTPGVIGQSGANVSDVFVTDVFADSTGVLGIANRGGRGTGVVGRSSSNHGVGVSGLGFKGVVGTSNSPDGIGVHGTSRIARGVFGESMSPSGVGVEGAAQNIGVKGSATAPSGSATGVRGESSSTNGIGIHGFANATNGSTIGVMGASLSTDGVGVLGFDTASSGSATGVRGESSSTNGTGVQGFANATNGSAIGVKGVSLSTDGVGVVGESPGLGVSGFARASSGQTTGVRGSAGSPDGIGVEGIGAANGGNIGVRGRSASPTGIGVNGFNEAASGRAVGVNGRSDSHEGVAVEGFAPATSGITTGVLGAVRSPSGVGVEANNSWAEGVGLRVSKGRSQFATILDGGIKTGASSVTVTDNRVKAESEVLIMLRTDPGSLSDAGVLANVRNSVSWIQVVAGSFTVNLQGPARQVVRFRAFIVEKV